MQRRRLAVLLSAGVSAVIVAGVANAAVFARLLHTEAKAGELVAAQVDEWTVTHHPPLYIVPERTSFAFTTTRWPLRAPFVRLRNVEWGPVTDARAIIRFRAPRLRPARYRLVIYCAPCVQGPKASVIGSVNTVHIR